MLLAKGREERIIVQWMAHSSLYMLNVPVLGVHSPSACEGVRTPLELAELGERRSCELLKVYILGGRFDWTASSIKLGAIVSCCCVIISVVLVPCCGAVELFEVRRMKWYL